MRGWSVFTRPPSISGAAVTSSTRVTGRPCSSRNAAVPPDETSSQPSSCQPACEHLDARLVPDADQRARHSSLTTSGSSRCSTAWMRARDRSCPPARPARAPGAITGAGVESLVDVVDGHAGRRRLPPRGRRRSRARPGTRAGATGARSRCGRGKRSRNGLREEVHVAREHDELDAVLLEPAWPSRGRAPRGRMAVERERRRRDARLACRAIERVRVLAVRGDGDDRQAVVDQRLQVRAVAGDEDADHTIRPITVSPGCASATTAHQPMPRLKTRRSSSSSTCRASQAKTGGRAHASQSSSARVPAGRTRVEVAEDPAAGDVRERLGASAQARVRRRGRGAWVRAGRRRRSPRPRARGGRA